jgi:macrolide-specific efflux system membrane fusion protein
MLLHGMSREAPTLPTATVRVSDLEQVVLATGMIQPQKMVSVGAQASGRVVALHVNLGDHIIKGQLIAEIEPSTERNALKIAQATLQQERAQRASRAVALKQAERNFRRAQATYSLEASSQADYESAEATFEALQAELTALDSQIKQASLQVDTARVTLGYTNVIAPMDGTVVAIMCEEGQTLNAVLTAPAIVKLANLDVMTVKAQISEADVTRVHPGQRVYFTILGAPEHRFYSVMRSVEPAPESIGWESGPTHGVSSSSAANAAIYYNGLFEISNPNHELRPSMTAQVSIVIEGAKSVLTIPSSALMSPNRDGSFRIETVDAQGKAQSRRITVGINNNVSAQIVSGLKVGDVVVIAGEAPP